MAREGVQGRSGRVGVSAGAGDRPGLREGEQNPRFGGFRVLGARGRRDCTATSQRQVATERQGQEEPGDRPRHQAPRHTGTEGELWRERSLRGMERDVRGETRAELHRGRCWQLVPRDDRARWARKGQKSSRPVGTGLRGWARPAQSPRPTPSPRRTHGRRPRCSHRSPGSSANASGGLSSPPGGTQSCRQPCGDPEGPSVP